MIRNTPIPLGVVDADWFWSRASTGDPDSCWPWMLGRTPRGYGVAWLRGRNVRAHRVAWAIENGCDPSPFHVLHKCDNPPCCNPSHLFLGTDADNVADMRAKGRGFTPSSNLGVDHCSARLTPLNVASIRMAHANGTPQSHIAATFGVTPQAIWKVIHRKTWKDA